jgi:hypothetical protein
VTILGTVESRFLRIHQTIYEATRGVLGHRLIGVPTLLLTSPVVAPGVDEQPLWSTPRTTMAH